VNGWLVGGGGEFTYHVVEFIPLGGIAYGVGNVTCAQRTRTARVAVSNKPRPRNMIGGDDEARGAPPARTDVEEEVARLRGHVLHHQARGVARGALQVPVLL
jgi:hypothetical protein